MGIKVGNRHASVEISDEIEEMVRRVVADSAPTLLARMEEVTADLKEQAAAEWPVGRDRGRPHSRDLFESGVRLSSRTMIEGYVTNSASYAYYIKPKAGRAAGKSAVSKLLYTPGTKAGKALAAELSDEIKKLARGD